ncbi:MAG TPA: glycosyltransferase family A protein [Pyrinomonadaceae bacterium]|jgi:glycosyltransferase involved in cell wall biosynthesis
MNTVTETQAEMHAPARIARHAAVPPAVSVIIPAYEVAPYINEALDSVLAQEFKDYEIIVINDGSPDTAELERVLEPYREHLVYLKQNNRGAAAARNAGLYVARGEFVAFLDADDFWQPDFLASQMEFLKAHEACDLVYADARLFGETPHAGRTYMQTTPSKGAVTFESLVTARCNVITSGVVARRQVILDVGLFDEQLKRAHDFDLWLRVVRHGASAAYQKKVLLNYRVRLDSLSGDSIQRIERELKVYTKIESQLDLTPDERELISREIQRIQAALKIERGKLCLARQEFEMAAREFREAYRLRRNLKLALIMLMLRLAPHSLLRMYQKHRTPETQI